MEKVIKKTNINLKKDLTEITEKYKQILKLKKEIIKSMTEFLDNEVTIKPQIEDPYWVFEEEVESLVKRIEAEAKNNNLVSYFLENLKKGVK